MHVGNQNFRGYVYKGTWQRELSEQKLRHYDLRACPKEVHNTFFFVCATGEALGLELWGDLSLPFVHRYGSMPYLPDKLGFIVGFARFLVCFPLERKTH